MSHTNSHSHSPASRSHTSHTRTELDDDFTSDDLTDTFASDAQSDTLEALGSDWIKNWRGWHAPVSGGFGEE